jgi:hypothetical protein
MLAQIAPVQAIEAASINHERAIKDIFFLDGQAHPARIMMTHKYEWSMLDLDIAEGKSPCLSVY